MIIHIFGSSGSGTTTLAKELAEYLNLHHIDVDDLMWEKTDPPFTVKRSNESIRQRINEDLSHHQDIVISGSIVNIYDDLKPSIDLFIYMNLDIETRKERINQREVKRFGHRILPGGDLYHKHQSFLEWVSDYEHNPETIRSRKQHLSWLNDVKKPVLRITEELSLNELKKLVKSYLINMNNAI